MGVPQGLEARRDEILRVVSSHGAGNVRVFGSRGRGLSRANSDLDLLAGLDPGRSILDLIAIKQDLEDLLNCAVDVVTTASSSPYTRREILASAVAL